MVDIASVSFLPEQSAWSAVPQLEDGWYPTGGPVDPAADGGLLNWPLKVLGDRTRWLRDHVEAVTIRQTVTAKVGPGEQFTTINAALEALSRAFPTHVAGGLSASIQLQPGFIMREQVFVSGVNCGWITIAGLDPMTQIDRAALTRAYGGRYPAFAAYSGGWLPIIAQLFEMSSAGDGTARDGILVSGAGSGVRVNDTKGVRRAGGTALRVVTGGAATAPAADFREAAEYGIVASGAATVDAAGVNVSAAGKRGIWANGSATVNVAGANATVCVEGGIYASLGARINADGVNAANPKAADGQDIVVATGGIINASGSSGGTSQAPNAVTASGLIFK